MQLWRRGDTIHVDDIDFLIPRGKEWAKNQTEKIIPMIYRSCSRIQIVCGEQERKQVTVVTVQLLL